MTEGKDYSVKYSNNINVGQATVEIKGEGNYKGNIIKIFKIEKVDESKPDISKLEVKLEQENYKYDGKEKEPKVIIEGLTEGKDYTVSYADNKDVGKGKVIIEGIGNYRGTIIKEFIIEDSRIDISSLDISMGTKQLYAGTARQPIVKIQGLTKGKDYSVSYQDNINVGDAKAVIKGIGNYTGKVTRTFIIYNEIRKLDANLSYTSCEYDGKEKEPKVTIKGLTEGKDYSVSYSNNINVGQATVRIKGLTQYYTGTLIKTFEITQKDISSFNADLSYTSCEYNGKEKEPKVTIKGLTEGKDYSVKYSNNIDVGDATVEIKGEGNYKGEILEKGGIIYSIIDNNAIVTNILCDNQKIIVPNKIQNYNITKISNNAFDKVKNVKYIRIGENVKKISKNTFKNCKNIILEGKVDSYINKYANENKIIFKEIK